MARRQQKEVRIDPEDGQPRTFEELRTLCEAKYTLKEIEAYWETKMIHHVGEGIHNVAADPFLTHASQNPVAASNAERANAERAVRAAALASAPNGTIDSIPDGLANVQKDPFLAASKYAGGRTVDPSAKNDPFATGPLGVDADAPGTLDSYGSIETLDPSQGPSKREQLVQAVQLAEKTAAESFASLLGPGDPGRDEQSRKMAIMGPWLLYLWVILLRLILSHYSELAATILISLVAASCGAMLVFWYRGFRRGPVSLLAAGALGLVATTAGANVGTYGYEMYYRQYWWTETGQRGGITTASVPALARSDFAVLNFWNSAHSTTYNETRVDPSRGAGYKDTDYYCVAPILSPEIAGAALVRVNYWAIGINCCQLSGQFTCDGSREWNAGLGVVMVDGGFPCPSCNTEQFRLAVGKAEAMHGLVSANGAMFVRFVQDSGSVELSMLLRCLGFVLVATLLGGLGCAALGSLMWYYGVGISGPREPPLMAGASGRDLTWGASGKDLKLPLTTPLNSGPPGGRITRAPAMLGSFRRR